MTDEDRLAKLEADIRVLKDKDEIWRLISRYARAMDEEIDDELAAIFTEDVAFETKPWSGGEQSGLDWIAGRIDLSNHVANRSTIAHVDLDGDRLAAFGLYLLHCGRESSCVSVGRDNVHALG